MRKKRISEKNPRTVVQRIYASCNLSLLFYALLRKWWWISFCAEESPQGWIRAGEVRTVWETVLVPVWRKCFERWERFQFAPEKPKCVRGNQMKPIWNLRLFASPNLNSSGKNEWRSCHQGSGAQRLTFTVPSSHGQRDDLMNHTFQGARRCPYELFFVCLSQCVSVSETLNRFTWYQCWLKTCFLKALSLDVAEQRCMSV